MKQTETLVTEIVQIAEAQAKSSAEAVSSVDGIATVAEETSASTEEASAAAEEQSSSMAQITETAQSLADIASRMQNKLRDVEKESDAAITEKYATNPTILLDGVKYNNAQQQPREIPPSLNIAEQQAERPNITSKSRLDDNKTSF